MTPHAPTPPASASPPADATALGSRAAADSTYARDPRVADLLSLWQSAQTQGKSADLEALCGGCPELLPELRRQVAAVARMEAAAAHLGDTFRFISDGAPAAAPASTGAEACGGAVLAGRYQLGEELARGGMGIVYRATDLAFSRAVAVKMVQERHARDLESLRRFAEEAHITGQLQHPGVPPVHELGYLPDGRPFLVMKLIKGRTLAELVNDSRGRAPTERTRDGARFLAIFEKICETMAYAHSRGVIHRDLKPANIMVGAFGETQVMDWGLAKLLKEEPPGSPRRSEPALAPEATAVQNPRADSGDSDTEAGSVMGTLAFMAPEQAAGAVGLIDQRSDVFGLGAILCVLLTGEPPYAGATNESLRMNAALADLEPAYARLDRCGAEPELVALAKRCLAAKAALRPADAGAVAEAVAAFRAGAEARARHAEVERVRLELRDAEARRRQKLAWGIAAATLAGLVAAGAFGVWAMREKDRAEAAQRLATERLAEVKRQKQLTEEEAAIAIAVNAFVQNDLLGQAEPAKNARADRVTVEEVLKRAAARLPGRFAAQPATEAALRSTIGGAYRALGDFTAAQPHLERAYDLRRRTQGPDGPDTLATLSNLAGLLREQGQFAQAEALLLQALEASRRAHGAENPVAFTILNNLAEALATQGELAKAEPLYLQALAGKRGLLGAEHPETLMVMNNLASLRQAQGKLAEAEPLFVEALAARRRTLGEEHPDTLQSLTNLAGLRHAQNRLADAEPLFLQALAGRRRTLGEEHPETVMALNNVGFLRYGQGKPAEAEQLFAQALAVRRRTLGDGHPDTQLARNNLAAALQAQGRLADAEEHYEAAWSAQRKSLGEEHPDTLNTMNNLAALRYAQADFAEAGKLFAAALEMQRKKLGASHPQARSAQANLIETYRKCAPSANAEALLRSLLKEEEDRSPDGWATHELRSMVGAALTAREKFAEAEPLLLAADAGLKRQAAQMPAAVRQPRLQESAARLARLYQGWGKPEEARKWRGQALKPDAPASPSP